jgi:hypothetical protein
MWLLPSKTCRTPESAPAPLSGSLACRSAAGPLLAALLSCCRGLPDTAPASVSASSAGFESAAAELARPAPRAPNAAAAATATAAANAEVEAAPRGTSELELEGFLPSLMSWPAAERWPQPVMLVAHGARERAEPHCEFWRHMLGARGILVCLRGRPLREGSEDQGYFFPTHLSLGREAMAALDGVARRYPQWADTRRAVYAGFSQGAQMGLLMAVAHGDRLPRLLLIEGGAGDFSAARARRFRNSGGERVALVCGRPSCHRNAERSLARLLAAGIPSATYYAPGAGHTYLGAVAERLGDVFATLTQGDKRWGPPR